MKQDKRIHIMSAGQSLHKTFPTAIKHISYATKLYVIIEDRVYEKADKEENQIQRDAIINSIKKLEEIATPFVDDGVEVIRIPNDTLDHIRDAVVSMYEKNKDAQYYLNLSGGTKALSIGLFMMALWIEAIPYHIDRDGNPRLIPIPKVHMGDFQKNPNRILILDILSNQPGKSLSRRDLKNKLDKRYIPVKDSRKSTQSISYGGFTSLIDSLIEWNLIEKRFLSDSEKEIEYHITPDGEFTLRFVEI